MKTLIIFTILCLAVTKISGYCFATLAERGSHCTTKDGIVIQINQTYEITSKCERCKCTQQGPGQVSLGCCGYGIHAGVFAAPSGCKVITDTDGCTPKLVKIGDETQLCGSL